MDKIQLETERLLLITMNYSMIRSLIDGTYNELRDMGLTFSPGWPRQDTLDILGLLANNMKENHNPSGYEVWLIVKKDEMVIIGDIGFTGPPDIDGKVEIGYGLVESERNNKYGYEAARALTQWALEQNKVKIICADGVLVDNIGSIRILKKIGMKEIGRDGNGIYFEMKKKN